MEDVAHSTVCKSIYTANKIRSRLVPTKLLQSLLLSRIRRKVAGWNFARATSHHDIFVVFPQFFYWNAGYYVTLRHQRLIPHPLQYAIHCYTIILHEVCALPTAPSNMHTPQAINSVVTTRTTRCNIRNSAFCQHSVFTGSVNLIQ